MIRGVARLMGAAAVGAAAGSPSSSVALCHVSSQEHLNFPPVLNLPQKEACGSLPSKPLVDVRYVDTEDWEYPLEEDWSKRSHNHLVFAPAPSEEEVEEATKELHAALHLSIPPSSLVVEGSRPEPMLDEQQTENVPAVVDQEKVADKSLPSLSTRLGLLAVGSSSVYQAFQLLQTNPKVQDAVKSLARDPAVWKAVLSNEKVLELTQTLQDGDETAGLKKSSCRKDDSEEINILKLTSKVCDFVTGKVLQILDKVGEIVGSIFTSVEKAFFSKDGTSTMDKTVASCMMLTVAVLLVVVVKRVAIK